MNRLLSLLLVPLFFSSPQKVRPRLLPIYIIGSTRATCDVEIDQPANAQITERGLVWSLKSKPTLKDQKIVHLSNDGLSYRLTIPDLSARTTYFVRAYVVTNKGAKYSNELSFRTIAKGKITYTINKDAHPNDEQLKVYERLKVAADSAVWYLENYTSATKHVTINYAEGTTTADANSNGWMRFGKKEGFQNLRTMLHEMNHALGTGTTKWWTSQITANKFTGIYTNELLRKITKNAVSELNADRQHWWPYGLNQNNEVTSSWDYVFNCILIEAMRKDGLLTQTSGEYQP